MNAKLKAKWVKALRSGKYKQGRFWLHNGGHFCCLGVLCVVRGLKPAKTTENIKIPAKFGNTYFEEQCGIPAMIKATLVDMNDGDMPRRRPKRFSAIAAYIEKNL